MNKLLALALLGICFGMATTPGSGDPPGSEDRMEGLSWHDYGARYAIIVMGGHEHSGGQLYRWYWGDTHGMYLELKDLGFEDDNIHFLSYGDSAAAYPEHVDGVSTSDNVRSAYNWAESACIDGDLLYVFWVDHGSPTYFVTYDGLITHAELGLLMQPIVARAIIGAYNPCYSGAVIDDISRFGVITVTSQDATHPNSWGWAGKWRRALRGAPEDSVDTNGDGHICMTEAYEWICPRSQDAGEHSTYDDNGDGVGHECDDPGFDPSDPEMDGHFGKFYALDGWAQESGSSVDPGLPANMDTSILFPAVPNPFGRGTTIRYALQQEEQVALSVHAVDGRRLTTLHWGLQDSGLHTIVWRGESDDGSRLGTGIYYVKLRTGGAVRTRMVCLMR
jgi:hypothetical protein